MHASKQPRDQKARVLVDNLSIYNKRYKKGDIVDIDKTTLANLETGLTQTDGTSLIRAEALTKAEVAAINKAEAKKKESE